MSPELQSLVVACAVAAGSAALFNTLLGRSLQRAIRRGDQRLSTGGGLSVLYTLASLASLGFAVAWAAPLTPARMAAIFASFIGGVAVAFVLCWTYERRHPPPSQPTIAPDPEDASADRR
jgi:hypothetical protein